MWQIASSATCAGTLRLLLDANEKRGVVLPVGRFLHLLWQTAARCRRHKRQTRLFVMRSSVPFRSANDSALMHILKM